MYIETVPMIVLHR